MILFILAILLFLIGLYGVLVKRNLIKMIIGLMIMEYAVNLDGGYSSALWYNDEYMVGPGRNIPNAIIFANK